MHRCDKLLRKAQDAPGSLKFMELCYLAECYGFEFVRQDGSHRLYKRKRYPRLMNFQSEGGNAKEYQVRQLLMAITELGPWDNEEG